MARAANWRELPHPAPPLREVDAERRRQRAAPLRRPRPGAFRLGFAPRLSPGTTRTGDNREKAQGNQVPKNARRGLEPVSGHTTPQKIREVAGMDGPRDAVVPARNMDTRDVRRIQDRAR